MDASRQDFLSFFSEAPEAIGIIKDVVNGETDLDNKVKRFEALLSYYQEQAELLDPHLEAMITPLTGALLEAAEGKEKANPLLVCSLLQCLTKVRGHKSVVKFYPVDVKCFLPILRFLRSCISHKNKGDWQAYCQLMLWLSNLCLVPFDLETVEEGVVQEIVDITDGFLHEAGTVREFACILLYRLLTRSDMEKPLEVFVKSAMEVMENKEAILYVIGVIQALSFVFKHGRRTALLSHAHVVWPIACRLIQSQEVRSSLFLRKLGTKLVQRLALTLLPPITPKWRYIQTTALHKTTEEASTENVDDVEYQIPDEIEEVIQLLLTGVGDKDTFVRWSAAKGLGRVCARLPKELADEVLSAVVELFSETAEDFSWHGGCLSVAELARRGLLLPESIPNLVASIEKALTYDINRGTHSIGANVRDAACYVCWAFARSFDAEILSPFMPRLAPVLMTTACLDREVNCRRAAAAAFQECVGRIGNVPEGMSILECADYFTLSKRPNAYLMVTPSVAKFPAYSSNFVAHLMFEKVGHWDPSLRQLTADALGKLVPMDPEYFACDGIDLLLGWCMNSNLDQRHGACVCLAAVIEALVEDEAEIPEDRLTGIANIVMKIERARLYRGKGGSLMRQGVVKIIEAISRSHLTRSLKHRCRLLTTINECIIQPNPEIPPDALKALKALSREFLPEEIETGIESTTRVYLGHLDSENVAFRRGYTSALGMLPRALLIPGTHECEEALRQATKIEDDPEQRDPESRANAVRSLTEVVCQLYSDVSLIADAETYIEDSIMETMFEAMEDYSTDRRGDVGSWIREAAMQGMRRILTLIASHHKPKLECVGRVMAYLIRNAVERIAHIRQVAVRHLRELLDDDDIESPYKTEVMEISNIEDWMVVFGTERGVQMMVSLLRIEMFRTALMEGLLASIGGLDKSLSDAASFAVVGFLESVDDVMLQECLTTFMDIALRRNKCKRMSGPVLATMDILCKSSIIFQNISQEYKAKMVKLVRTATAITSDYSRLTTAASVLTALAFENGTSEAGWTELMVLLTHRFPFVRKHTAETIYEKLLFQEDSPKIASLTALLLETAWDGDLEDVVPNRNKFCEILKLKPPIRKQRGSKKKGGVNTPTDENASYQTLVEDFARGM